MISRTGYLSGQDTSGGTMTAARDARAVLDGPGRRARWTSAPSQYRHRHPVYQVLVESGYRTFVFQLVERLEWDEITLRTDGMDTTATVSANLRSEDLIDGGAPAPGGIGARHFIHWLQDLTADKRIIIRKATEDEMPLFVGYAQVATIRWDDRQQVVSVQCRSYADVEMEENPQSQVWGRNMRQRPWLAWDTDATDVTFTDMPLHFNPGGEPNRLADPIEVEIMDSAGEFSILPVYLFDGDTSPVAEHWSVAQAIIYLVYYYLEGQAQDIDVSRLYADVEPLQELDHNPGDSDLFRRRMTTPVHDLRLDAMSIRSALVTLCTHHGLHIDTPIIRDLDSTLGWTHSLRIWPYADEGGSSGAAMGRAEDFDWPRDPPWKVQGAAAPQAIAQANVTDIASFTTDHRATNQITVLDSPHYYEVAFELRPGWVPFVDAHRATDYPGVTLAQLPTYNVFDDIVDVIGGDPATLIQLYWRDLTAPVMDDSTPIPSIHHSGHALHRLVANVGRLWIFPTDQRRTSGEYERSAPLIPWGGLEYLPWQDDPEGGLSNTLAVNEPLGVGLSVAAGWACRPRPILSPISEMRPGAGAQPIYLEMKFQTTDDWTHFDNVQVNPLPDETGVFLNIPDFDKLTWPHAEEFETFIRGADVSNWGSSVPIPNKTFLNAFLNQTLRIRVTCTIEGDERLKAIAEGVTTFERDAAQVLDAGGRFRHRIRNAANSPFRLTEPTDPRYQTIIDTDRLQAYADDEAKQAAIEPTSGNPAVWWIEPTLQLGDRVTGILGIGNQFPEPTEIVTIRYTRLPARTNVHLADVRFDADIDMESIS